MKVYLELLAQWEESAINIKHLNEERKYLKRKLDAYFKTGTSNQDNDRKLEWIIL